MIHLMALVGSTALTGVESGIVLLGRLQAELLRYLYAASLAELRMLLGTVIPLVVGAGFVSARLVRSLRVRRTAATPAFDRETRRARAPRAGTHPPRSAAERRQLLRGAAARRAHFFGEEMDVERAQAAGAGRGFPE